MINATFTYSYREVLTHTEQKQYTETKDCPLPLHHDLLMFSYNMA